MPKLRLELRWFFPQPKSPIPVSIFHLIHPPYPPLLGLASSHSPFPFLTKSWNPPREKTTVSHRGVTYPVSLSHLTIQVSIGAD